MPRPEGAITRAERRQCRRPERIQAGITDEFQEIRLFLHDDRLVAVLKEMAGTVVPPVERAGVPREETSQTAGERVMPRADQEVGVVRPEVPSSLTSAPEGRATAQAVACSEPSRSLVN